MEQITKIREAIPSDKLEQVASALNDVEHALVKAVENESKVKDLQLKLEQAESEKAIAERDMMKYKSIQRKATDQLNELESNLAGVEELKSQLATANSKIENLKVLEEERDNGIRSDYQKILDEIKELEAFDKVKNDIVLPTDEEKLENFAIDEIQASKKTIEKYKNLGVFGAVDSRTGDSQAPKPKGDVDTFFSSMRKGAGLKPK